MKVSWDEKYEKVPNYQPVTIRLKQQTNVPHISQSFSYLPSVVYRRLSPSICQPSIVIEDVASLFIVERPPSHL